MLPFSRWLVLGVAGCHLVESETLSQSNWLIPWGWRTSITVYRSLRERPTIDDRSLPCRRMRGLISRDGPKVRWMNKWNSHDSLRAIAARGDPKEPTAVQRSIEGPNDHARYQNIAKRLSLAFYGR